MALDDPEVSVVLTDDEHIRELNQQWREEDKPTDVLSFPLQPPGGPDLGDLPGPTPLGDIIIDLEYAERLVQTREHHERVAEELGVDPADLDWTFEDEVHFLFIHGLLHLVGYDHLEPDEEAEMKAMERTLWEAGREA